MQHHIWTTFGDSATSASRMSWQVPIAGIGQGNGAGPHIWAAVSSPMLDVMRLDGFYAHVITSISHLSNKFVSFSVVDDTDLCIHGPHINTQNATTAMQLSIDHWEGLLQTTGGALVPTKCSWYLINFQWSNSKWTYVTKQEHLGELVIKDELQHRVQIPQLETPEACQTLGICLAPDGNWCMEVNYLHSIVLDWRVKMAASCLSPADALFSL